MAAPAANLQQNLAHRLRRYSGRRPVRFGNFGEKPKGRVCLFSPNREIRHGESLQYEFVIFMDDIVATIWLDNAHRELNAAVAAYGWPADIAEEEALAQLLALNLERSGPQ
jgi:hypothetical protein